MMKGAGWILLLVCTTGCFDRARLNSVCEWTNDPPRRLALSVAADQEHLDNDAQLAEELAIRNADAQYERLTGYRGHGGLLENGRLRDRCMARLVAAIEQTHGVTASEIQDARAHRDWRLDALVGISFAVLYVVAAALVTLFLVRWLRGHEPAFVGAALVFSSVAGGVACVPLLAIWSAIAEAMRVGDDHLSGYRASTQGIPWHHHFLALFITGVVLFWLAAFGACRQTRLEGGAEPGSRRPLRLSR